MAEALKIKNKKLVATILSVLLFLFLVPSQTFAICEGPIVPCGRAGTPSCTLCHFFELLNNIITFIFTCLAPVTAGLMLVLGGFYFLAGGVDPTKLGEAKKIIWAVVIGLIVIFIAWVFLNTFLTTIGVAEWTGFIDNPATPEVEGWWEIQCQ